MTRGLGIDLVSIPRIRRMMLQNRAGLRQVILGARELAALPPLILSREVSFIAGRFAAKEAVLKVLGTGIGPISLQEIAIMASSYGQPQILLSGRASIIAEQLGISHWYLSISHERDIAIAFVIAE